MIDLPPQPPPDLADCSKVVEQRLGLHFPPERDRDLLRGLSAAARDLGLTDARACAEWLRTADLSRLQMDTLASHLTVGETYFLRDRPLLEALGAHVLAPLLRARAGNDQRIRIWSAGCATGEEAYSLAITLDQQLPNRHDWEVTILATDVNPHALNTGRTGRYRDWSFRLTPASFASRYFSKGSDGTFTILPRFRDMVTFAYLNLAEDQYPDLLTNTVAMDVICCRHVLMYFSEEQRGRVLQRLERCLADDGVLMVGAAECPGVARPNLQPVQIDGGTVFRKRPPAGLPHATALAPTPPATATPPDSNMPPAVDAPPSPDAWYAKAEALCAGGQDADATVILDELLRTQPDHTRALALMARTHANRGHLREAARWITHAVTRDKLNPAVHYLHATILQEEGQLDSCRAALRQALFLDPHFVLAHFMLGSLAFQHGATHDANRQFDEVLALLHAMPDHTIVPESDGITAARLRQIVAGMRMRRTIA